MIQTIESFPITGEHRGERFRLAPARYAKGKVALQCVEIKRSGFKSSGHWLAEALGARWSGRCGYLLAPTRARQWHLLFMADFEASRKYFGRDKTPYTFGRNDNEKLTLKEAVQAAQT